MAIENLDPEFVSCCEEEEESVTPIPVGSDAERELHNELKATDNDETVSLLPSISHRTIEYSQQKNPHKSITPPNSSSIPPPATQHIKSSDQGRLVIHKMVLTNFKSYAGRQEIGPFHKVCS